MAKLPAFLIVALLLSPLPARAADVVQNISVVNRIFTPSEFTVPANQKVKIVIKNDSEEPAEFESLELNREKVIPAHDQVIVYIGPLDPGSYPFFNDFDPNKSTGKVIVK